jgi:hypothetical protein
MEIVTEGCGVARRSGQVAVALVALALLLYSQPLAVATLASAGTDSVSQLVGSWESEDKLDGQPRVTVELTMEDGKPTGTVVIRGVQGDNGSDSLTLPIRDGKLQAASLWFETDPGQDGITLWSIGMVSDEKALLSAVRDNFEIPKYVMQRPAGH